MSILEASGIKKDFGGVPVLAGASMAIEESSKMALVGRNGSGKTTLINILMGLDDDYHGAVRRAPGLRVAYVSQRPPEFPPGETAAGFMCREVAAMRAGLERLAEAMASDASALARYAALREAYDAEDGDMAEEAAARLLAKAGLGDRADTEASSLSGGEKNVLCLVKAVRRMPGLLVLDEPGNHLDMAGLAWLEDFLASLPCAVLLVSHDRRMLDRVADGVLELEGGKITRYAGNYSAYRLERLKEAAGQGQDWQADKKRIERLEALVRRFADIARSRPDPSWGKRLRAKRSLLARVKADATERPDLGDRDARVSFLGEASKADLALRVEGYEKAYGDARVLEPSGFTVMNGERVALIGPNGSGKTSLVRDVVESGSWDNRTLRLGPSMVVGYCAQAQEVFDPESTVEEAFLKILPTSREVLAHLGRFLFGYDDLSKLVGSLSGGERNRLQLARASALKANFLILDEPTNHLDIPTREAVEEALADFEGAVLVVSHDRYFLEKIAERVVFIEGRRFNEYEGSFLEYWRDVGMAKARAARSGGSGLEDRGRRAGRQATAPKAGGDAGLEASIEAMEREKERLERESAAAFDRRDFKEAKAIAAELEAHNARLSSLWKRFAG